MEFAVADAISESIAKRVRDGLGGGQMVTKYKGVEVKVLSEDEVTDKKLMAMLVETKDVGATAVPVRIRFKNKNFEMVLLPRLINNGRTIHSQLVFTKDHKLFIHRWGDRITKASNRALYEQFDVIVTTTT